MENPAHWNELMRILNFSRTKTSKEILEEIAFHLKPDFDREKVLQTIEEEKNPGQLQWTSFGKRVHDKLKEMGELNEVSNL